MRSLTRSRPGYAMILAIMISMIMATLSTALVATGNAELQGARVLTGRTEARDLSTSALEEFYANVQTVPGFLDPLQTGGSVNHPAYTPPTSRNTPAARWARLDGVTPASCTTSGGQPDLNADCYSISARYETGAGVGQGRSVLLDVTTRVRCGGVEQRCIYARYQQRMRQAQFYDYMFFYKFATLDPILYPASDAEGALNGCADRYAVRTNADNGKGPRASTCVNVAYIGKTSGDGGGIANLTSRDVIEGPVYTADDRIPVCGNPVFNSTVSVAGAGNAGNVWISTSGCPPTSGSLIPAERQRLNSEPLGLPPTGTVAANAAQLADPSWVVNASASVTLSASGSSTTVSVAEVSGGTRTLSLNTTTPQVLVIQGDAEIRGTLAGRLSVVAAGNIVITGNLTYANGGTTSNTQDALGLTAGGAIIITQEYPPVDRTIHAALLSLESTIFVLEWDIPRFNPDPSNPAIPDYWSLGNSDPGWVEKLFPGYTSDCTPPPTPIDECWPAFYDEFGGLVDPGGCVTVDYIYHPFKTCWENNGRPVGTPPKLTFFGAMASKYQGVFGGFNPSTGDIISGYTKSFSFDTRMTDAKIAPPYIVTPTAASWQRLEMVEVPVDAI